MSERDDKAAYGSDSGKPKVLTPDAAFTESAGHHLNGLTLQPYTPERMWAADAMGLRYGHLSEVASRQFTRNSTYPGMEGDVGIVIWLCSLTEDEEVRAARRDPERAEVDALEFAKKHKILTGKQSAFWDAYKIFLAIMNEIHVAYGEPATKVEQKKTSK